MEIIENEPLSRHSTMRLGGTAKYFCTVKTEEELRQAVVIAKNKGVVPRMIGEGSNIIWRDEGFAGMIILNKITGKEVIAQDQESATLMINAGENWDGAVAWTVEKGLSGIEFLSLIPGNVGAAPVQNIGAYGSEIANVTKEVGVYNIEEDCFESIPASECGFTYRSSRFKKKDNGKFFITHLIIVLKKSNPRPPFYESLERYFKEHPVKEYNPSVIREAVIAIRSAKLPDPRKVANNGSFFTNPFVTKEHFEELKRVYPDIKGWPANDKVKLAAGWLVEQAGFKGYHDAATGMATWDKQALVLVNEAARTTKDLLEFRQKIMFKVEEMFGVKLEQEPELLP